MLGPTVPLAPPHVRRQLFAASGVAAALSAMFLFLGALGAGVLAVSVSAPAWLTGGDAPAIALRPARPAQAPAPAAHRSSALASPTGVTSPIRLSVPGSRRAGDTLTAATPSRHARSAAAARHRRAAARRHSRPATHGSRPAAHRSRPAAAPAPATAASAPGPASPVMTTSSAGRPRPVAPSHGHGHAKPPKAPKVPRGRALGHTKAAPVAPVAPSVPRARPLGHGKALGHGHANKAPKPRPVAAAPKFKAPRAPAAPHGHGRALGHAKHAMPAAAPSPAAPVPALPAAPAPDAPGRGHGHGHDGR